LLFVLKFLIVDFPTFFPECINRMSIEAIETVITYISLNQNN